MPTLKKLRPAVPAPQHCPTDFRKNSFDYSQLFHEDGWYAYVQFDDNETYGVEVWKERIQKEATFTLGGREIHQPLAHRLPSNESFGSWAWTKRVLGASKMEDSELAHIARLFIAKITEQYQSTNLCQN